MKWIPDQNLHVTVLFLGVVPEEKISSLTKKARTVAEKFHSFSINAYSLKIQKSKFQYMVWTSFHRSVEFEELVKELAGVLNYPVNRKALPHINLVRSKNKIPSDLFPILLKKEISFQVRYMELWESHLSPKGATYSVLNSFLFKELGI